VLAYVVAQAYSLEQQNAGRAHAELCHASGNSNVAIITYGWQWCHSYNT